QEYLNVAMAIECIHVYSLIHDDLPAMDNDDYRRGRLTSHKKFGENIAILAGDALLTLAFELLCKTKSDSSIVVQMINLVALHSGVNNGMINGQVLDILSTNDIDVVSLKEIHIQKTAKLLQLPLILGLLICDEENKIDIALKMGEAIGLAYQIQDDYLDKYGDITKLGKALGSDEANNKKTYVDLYTKSEIQDILACFTKEITEYLERLDISNELRSLITSLEKREF
ncbi:MAG: polyprenyl synthetase family protein, partial [Mycoplasmatales bacterium]